MSEENKEKSNILGEGYVEDTKTGNIPTDTEVEEQRKKNAEEEAWREQQ
ncbi:MAG: hypothetical protein WCW02_00760 [Candidatus Buchananbacteria bacterium]